MLARYKIYRGRRPPSDPQPNGVRQDTRWRTRHPLRPTEEIVKQYLAKPNKEAWRRFCGAYVDLLKERFRAVRTPFDKLAALAREKDVFIGCSCPTKGNPRIDRCHTFLALKFMLSKYRTLRIKLPPVHS